MKLKKRLHVMGKALHMELREHKSSFLVYVDAAGAGHRVNDPGRFLTGTMKMCFCAP